jgi:hypothetical protein
MPTAPAASTCCCVRDLVTRSAPRSTSCRPIHPWPGSPITAVLRRPANCVQTQSTRCSCPSRCRSTLPANPAPSLSGNRTSNATCVAARTSSHSACHWALLRRPPPTRQRSVPSGPAAPGPSGIDSSDKAAIARPLSSHRCVGRRCARSPAPRQTDPRHGRVQHPQGNDDVPRARYDTTDEPDRHRARRPRRQGARRVLPATTRVAGGDGRTALGERCWRRAAAQASRSRPSPPTCARRGPDARASS